jgi:hypothetical protein
MLLQKVRQQDVGRGSRGCHSDIPIPQVRDARDLALHTFGHDKNPTWQAIEQGDLTDRDSLLLAGDRVIDPQDGRIYAAV